MKTSKMIYRLQAEICQSFTNATRLEIIDILKNGEKNAGDISKILALSSPNVSQHLTKMRNWGVIQSRRDGVTIYYSLSDPKIIDAYNIMREVLQGQLKAQNQILSPEQTLPTSTVDENGSSMNTTPDPPKKHR